MFSRKDLEHSGVTRSHIALFIASQNRDQFSLHHQQRQTSAFPINVHTDQIAFHFFDFQVAYYLDSGTKGWSILLGKFFGVQSVVLFLY